MRGDRAPTFLSSAAILLVQSNGAMRRRPRLARLTLVPFAALALAMTAVGHAQRPAASPWTASKMPWGDPDLQGIWTYATMTPLERPRELAGKRVLTEEEAAEYERQVIARQSVTNNTAGPDWWDPGTQRLIDRRTSLIVDPEDGRLPSQTEEAKQRAAARAQVRPRGGLTDGPEDLGLNVRCLLWATAGPPMLPGVYNNNVLFVQTRNYTAIVNEMIHDARIVPTDGRPHGTVPRWLGDSRGHWEGATFVVDTINFTDKTEFRGATEHLHLVERFTRVDADTIVYRFTAEDPTTWTRGWTAEFPLRRTTQPMYEYACHEGNFRSMEGLLKGAAVQRVP
jgi:hypothetical protein